MPRTSQWSAVARRSSKTWTSVVAHHLAATVGPRPTLSTDEQGFILAHVESVAGTWRRGVSSAGAGRAGVGRRSETHRRQLAFGRPLVHKTSRTHEQLVQASRFGCTSVCRAGSGVRAGRCDSGTDDGAQSRSREGTREGGRPALGLGLSALDNHEPRQKPSRIHHLGNQQPSSRPTRSLPFIPVRSPFL